MSVPYIVIGPELDIVLLLNFTGVIYHNGQHPAAIVYMTTEELEQYEPAEDNKFCIKIVEGSSISKCSY